jgi:membrane fusion protein, multidrug efflux system
MTQGFSDSAGERAGRGRGGLVRRHFFLIAAVALVALMAIAVMFKVMAGPAEKGGPGGPGGPGGGGPGGPGGRTVQVTPVTVTPRTFTNRIEVLGVAKGRESLTVTSSTTELITRVLFRDGQWVKKGAPLVELQAREEQAGVLLARAALSRAQSSYNRWKELADRGFASPARLEEELLNLRTAQSTLAAAQARQGDRMIRAPFSGVVGLSDVTAGTLINPGSRIATLDDISLIRVDFPIPERYLPMLSQGQPIQARADALPNQLFVGRIAMLDTRVDERTRAITARAEFPNPGFAIRPGMMIRVSIEQGGRVAPAAPESAVQFEADTAFAYKLVSQGGRTIAQRTTVRRGVNEAGFVEILEGLQVGDRVVATGLNRIQPNAAVCTGADCRRAGGGGGRGGRRDRTAAP